MGNRHPHATDHMAEKKNISPLQNSVQIPAILATN